MDFWIRNRMAVVAAVAAALPVGIGCDETAPEEDSGVMVREDSGVPVPEDTGVPVPEDTGVPNGGDGGVPTPPGVHARPSRSAPIALTEDDAVVAMVDPQAGRLTTFLTGESVRFADVETGARPSSVVIYETTAYVANRGDATVVRIEGIDTDSPTITGTVEVGAEPTGLALSPTGARLFVAEHGEGSVGVIDTASMERVDSIDAPEAPYALAVTNDLDTDDDDELLFVPEFFGTPIGEEATNASRQGLVRVYRLSDLEPDGPITFAPIDSGFAPAEGEDTHLSSPNQLSSVAIQGGRIYVTSISVSPGAPVRFNLNVQPVIYVADIESREEVRDATGSVNLARLVRDAETDSRFFLADTVDLSFIGETGGVAYAVSRGADVVQRVVFGDTGVSIGSTQNLQIDVNAAPDGAPAGCLNPTGIVTAHAAPRAFLACWQSRSLGVVDLSTQALVDVARSTDPPSDAAGVAVARGARFFHTGRGRWSSEGWSSCASCHPGGLTDNVTWAFAAGPRQTTSMDGSYSHGSGTQVPRVLNWTGIFDELHDFERNTRGVSGGVGAVTNGDCGALATEARVDPLPGNLAQPIKELADLPDNCTEGDWDDIDAWVRTIPPPRGRRFVDAASVARGAALFGMPTASANNGGCVACHGGPGWTASRRFFTPSSGTNADLLTEPFEPPAAWPDAWSHHAFQIAPQPASAEPTDTVQGPPQVACVLRDVDTFGVPGDTAATDALELRDNGTRAQGAGGYNVPSLYGLNVGAPYLHHGGAATLGDLLTSARWEAHTRAANPAFLTTGDVDQQRADLIAFLRSIDASTPEQPLPSGFEGCRDFP